MGVGVDAHGRNERGSQRAYAVCIPSIGACLPWGRRPAGQAGRPPGGAADRILGRTASPIPCATESWGTPAATSPNGTARRGRIGPHRPGRVLQRYEQPHRRLLPLHDTLQVTDLRCGDAAALDLYDDLLRSPPRPVNEVDQAVDSPVSAALLLRLRLGFQQRHCPELELVGVLLPQGAGAALVLRLADNVVVPARLQLEGRFQAALHQRHGQVGDVYPDPLAAQLLRHRHRRAAPAEGVQHHVAFVGRGLDDAFQQSLGLLGGVAEAFWGLSQYRLYVLPNRVYWISLHLVKIVFLPGQPR